MKNSVIAVAVACTMSVATSYAQQMQGGICKEVNKAPDTVGCWIIAHDKIGTLQNAQTHWHIDTYPSEVAAMSAKGPRGSVLQAFGKVWLLTIDDAPKWSAPGGEHVTDVGPLPIRAGGEYAAQYMQAIFEPGKTAPSHHHSGPEAWYTLAGETCLENSGREDDRKSGWTTRNCAGWPAHAPHGDGHGATACHGSHSPRRVATSDVARPRLVAKGVVQVAASKRGIWSARGTHRRFAAVQYSAGSGSSRTKTERPSVDVDDAKPSVC